MFSFTHHQNGEFLETTLSGFWTSEEVARFSGELAPNLAQFRASHGALRMLVDARDFGVQADYVVQAAHEFERLMLAEDDDLVAFLVASALLKMQISRVHRDPRISVVISRQEAVAWLKTKAS